MATGSRFQLLGRPGWLSTPEMSLGEKFWQINWTLVILATAIAGVGIAMLYSAANGSMDPWAARQMVRFGAGLGLMIVLAVIDIRFWLRHAYLIYFGAFALLVAVEVIGTSGMGSWVSGSKDGRSGSRVPRALRCRRAACRPQW